MKLNDIQWNNVKTLNEMKSGYFLSASKKAHWTLVFHLELFNFYNKVKKFLADRKIQVAY